MSSTASSALFVSSAGASTERKVAIRSSEYFRCALNSICSRAPLCPSVVIRISAVKSLQPSCVTIRLTIAPTSGNGAGVDVKGAEESLGAFEAVSPPHPQSDEHNRISRAILLSCICLSDMLSAGVEVLRRLRPLASCLLARRLITLASALISFHQRRSGHGFILHYSGLTLEYRNPRRTLNAPVSVTPLKKATA